MQALSVTVGSTVVLEGQTRLLLVSDPCSMPSRHRLAVGPGRALATPGAAAAVARDYDTIDIDAGDYRGDTAVWRASNLTICARSGRVRLFADGQNALGKGLWVVQGNQIVIDSVEFHDAQVADQNGAGIRAEGNGLTVRNSGFYDNENGILGPSQGALTIVASEFARNGRGDGSTHNLYVGPADSLTVSASFFHETAVGHNLKSRARVNTIEDSYFMDGPAGTASYQIDLSYGGTAMLRGNLLFKSAAATNSRLVSYGAEGLLWPQGALSLVHNTLVTGYDGGRYINTPPGSYAVTLTANLFAGSNGAQLFDPAMAAQVSASNNVVGRAEQLPQAGNIAAPRFWPEAPLLAATVLGTVPDPRYTSDAAVPFQLRSFDTLQPRHAGALQAAP